MHQQISSRQMAEMQKMSHEAQSMMNGSRVSPVFAEIQQSPVDIALERLSSAISNARDEFGQIDSRLASILGTQNQSTALGGGTPVAAPSCQLESRINDMRYSVESMVEQMRSIRAALCI